MNFSVPGMGSSIYILKTKSMYYLLLLWCLCVQKKWNYTGIFMTSKLTLVMLPVGKHERFLQGFAAI